MLPVALARRPPPPNVAAVTSARSMPNQIGGFFLGPCSAALTFWSDRPSLVENLQSF